MKKTKVFGLGFQKTGTSTLKTALEILGYRVSEHRADLLEDLKNENYEKFLEIAQEFDGVQDNPWPFLYKHLDEKFPNSKFVLTVRDEEKWLKSMLYYFDTKVGEMREWIYGVGFPVGNEDVYLERYQNHNEEIINYFKDRKSDLLVVDWSEGANWDKLCAFLGEEIPNEDFPHTNKGNYNETKRYFKRYKRAIKKNLGLH